MGLIMSYLRIGISACIALVYLLLVGLLSLRADAAIYGGVLGWDNSLVSVTDTGSPWLQNLLVAALSGLLVFWFMRTIRGDQLARIYPAVSAFLVVTVAVVWFSATTDYSIVVAEAGDSLEAQTNPIIAWAQAGALNPAVHAVAAILAVIVVAALKRRTAEVRSAQSTGAKLGTSV